MSEREREREREIGRESCCEERWWQGEAETETNRLKDIHTYIKRGGRQIDGGREKKHQRYRQSD